MSLAKWPFLDIASIIPKIQHARFWGMSQAKRLFLLKAMLRRLHFCEDVSGEIAIWEIRIKYTKKSACPLLEDVSGETLIFVKRDLAKTSFL